MIMPERNKEGRVIGLPIMKMETNKKEIIDIHIYFDNERFQIRKEKEKPVECEKYLHFGHQKNVAVKKISISRSVQGL